MDFIDLAAQQRRLGDRLTAAIERVLDHRQFLAGPEVTELEDRLAAYCGVKHAIACSSGTDGLVLALMALGMQPGDRVVVPTFTFAATAEAVAFLGGVPVLVDVEPDTFTMDIDSLARALPGAVGVIPVDLFGHPALHGMVAELAARHGAWVLTDAAQSFGSTWDGNRAGAIGDMAITSFFPAKPLGCYGDGGAVFTDDDRRAADVRSLRAHGSGSHRYEHVRIGMTGRLDTIQAAILLAKLAVFDEELEARQAVAARYEELLGDVVTVPRVRPGCCSAWAQYTVLVDDRERVAAVLADAGIPTAVHYPIPLHRQPAYRRFPVAEGGAPCAEELATRVLSLPMHPYLTAADQERIASAVRVAVAG